KRRNGKRARGGAAPQVVEKTAYFLVGSEASATCARACPAVPASVRLPDCQLPRASSPSLSPPAVPPRHAGAFKGTAWHTLFPPHLSCPVHARHRLAHVSAPAPPTPKTGSARCRSESPHA